jgi:hypothetical protein
MFYSQISTVLLAFGDLGFDPGGSRRIQAPGRENKTPRHEGGEAQVMGGFPKEKQRLYTEFMPILLAPPM